MRGTAGLKLAQELSNKAIVRRQARREPQRRRSIARARAEEGLDDAAELTGSYGRTLSDRVAAAKQALYGSAGERREPVQLSESREDSDESFGQRLRAARAALYGREDPAVALRVMLARRELEGRS